MNLHSVNCLCLLLAMLSANGLLNGFQPATIASPLEDPQEEKPKDEFQILMNRNCQIHAVVLLDSILCFSEPQWDKTLELIRAQWDPSWNAGMESMTLRIWGSDRISMVKEIDFQELEPLLSEKQTQALGEIEVLAAVDFLDLMREDMVNELEARLQGSKAALFRMTELKLEELNRICEMENKQLDLLKVARNGLISRTVSRWQETLESYHADPNDKAIQKEVMVLIRGSLLGQCTDNQVWRQTLNKVFTDEQKEKIQARESMRSEATKNQFVNDMIVFWMLETCELKPDQYVELGELIAGNLKLKYGAEMLEAEEQVAQIHEEDFRKILSDKQWDALVPTLAQMRAQ